MKEKTTKLGRNMCRKRPCAFLYNKNIQNGITLIALIITIVILLILAMVSIKLILDGGIITHAQNAVNEYKQAQVNEQKKLLETEEKMKKIEKISLFPTEKEIGEMLGGMTAAAHKSINYDDDLRLYASFMKGKSGEKELFMVSVANENDPHDMQPMYMFFLTDDTIELINQSYGLKVEKNKWYYVSYSAHLEEMEEYNGPSPIQISDFADNEIYCKDYLQRIIDSFNN